MPESATLAAQGDERAYEALLEASWPGRGRAIHGRELRLELGVVAVFLLAAGGLALSTDGGRWMDAATVAVVVMYAIAARVEFPIGAGFFVPTQLLLVPLFVVAPAQYVPLLVFAAFVLAAVIAAATGAANLDRVVFSAGDAMHALGPAVVITVLAGGDATEAPPLVLVAAFVAQLAADLASSSLHELITMRARPQVHLQIMAQIWAVDVALGIIGVLVARQVSDAPWVIFAPLPLVLILGWLATDRVRKISAAHERVLTLELERGRRQAAVALLKREVEFLQDVSHELRTPVTIARGHVENFCRARGPSPQLDIALDELGRIDRIIGRLLVLARAGQPATFRPRPIDAEAYLEDRFVRWSDMVPRPWQLGDLVAGALTADRDALDAALDALLENAVKHTTRAQSIRLSSRSVDGEIVIEIADEGDGVPPEALDQIFDRFARADVARNSQIGGVGLGLAMVDAVAKAHGGRCSVGSSGCGSTFALRLPGFQPELPSEGDLPTAPPGPRGASTVTV